MIHRLQRWPALSVLAVGILLRIGLVIATPSRLAYDDHMTPIELMVHQHRLPLPQECWECFQPPLFYVTSSIVYAGAEKWAVSQGKDVASVKEISRKSVQCVSLVAGCATLLVCLAIIRRAARQTPWKEAMALGCVALMPQHIYMSAMVTNDAFAYFVASVAILMLLRASAKNWSTGATIIAATVAGLTVVAKGHGWMTVASVIGATGLYAIAGIRIPSSENSQAQLTSGRRWMTLSLVAFVSLLAGIGPAVRSYSLNPHFDSIFATGFTYFPGGAMQDQPPGSIEGVDFHTFHLAGLLARPWEHMKEVGSFWTQLYARYWFDYEGLTMTLHLSSEWRQHTRESLRWLPNKHEIPRRLLYWESSAIPQDLARAAKASYLAGVPITGLLLVGLVIAITRNRRDFAAILACVHFLACLSVPVVQTFRMPFFSSMKAAFTLNAISSWPMLIVGVLVGTRGRLGTIINTILASSLIVLLVANIYLIVWVWQHSAIVSILPR